MLITPFRVRLADKKDVWKRDWIGTVIGEDVIAVPGKGNQKAYLVIWTRVDEETGEESIGEQPAPSTHFPQELRAHVDPDHWDVEEYEEEEDEPLDLDAKNSDEGLREVTQ